jgi:hypothetical protein
MYTHSVQKLNKNIQSELLTFEGKSSHMKRNIVSPSTVPPTLSPQECL